MGQQRSQPQTPHITYNPHIHLSDGLIDSLQNKVKSMASVAKPQQAPAVLPEMDAFVLERQVHDLIAQNDRPSRTQDLDVKMAEDRVLDCYR